MAESLTWRYWIGLIGAPLFAALVLSLPLDLQPSAHRLSALMVWVVLWWVLETIPLGATALFGAAMSVALGIAGAKETFAQFGHPIIFLFLGGFLIAKAMSVHGLDRRIALFVLTRRLVAARPARTVVALMSVSALLSMWISNTATTAMMLPIGLGVVRAIYPRQVVTQGAVLLAIAYASSIGGVSTPVGSTPNIIGLGLLEELASVRVDFLSWMQMALPISALSIFALAVFTVRKLPRDSGRADGEALRKEYRELGPLNAGERNTLIAALTAVTLWVGPDLAARIVGESNSWVRYLSTNVSEGVAAVLAASLLFILPVSRKRTTLSWEEALGIDWGSLLLFGGGLALGSAMFSTGLAEVLGKGIIGVAGSSPWLFTIVMVYFAIFFTELTSNTATANILLPIVIAGAQELGFNPLIPSFGVIVACSLAFMLPVATPPNAIVYGSGTITISQMARGGFIMNLICGATILLVLWLATMFV